MLQTALASRSNTPRKLAMLALEAQGFAVVASAP
jgi:hypothetical protein